jgi:hypothetical protein
MKTLLAWGVPPDEQTMKISIGLRCPYEECRRHSPAERWYAAIVGFEPAIRIAGQMTGTIALVCPDCTRTLRMWIIGPTLVNCQERSSSWPEDARPIRPTVRPDEVIHHAAIPPSLERAYA